MIYNLKNVSTAYVKRFIDYTDGRGISAVGSKKLSELLCYSISRIFGLPYYRNNFYIEKYGADCISYLKKLRGVPKSGKRLCTQDKISILELCNGYYVAVDVLSLNKERVDGLNGFKESFR